MNLLRNGLLMRKTGDRRRIELTEESAFQCGFSAEFITPSRREPSKQATLVKNRNGPHTRPAVYGGVGAILRARQA